MFAYLAEPDDPRLIDYHRIADPSYLERSGLFVAEGRWVVERLLARPRYQARSLLVTPTALAALQRAVDASALDRVPVYVVEQRFMDRVVGFHIHRGCLALAERPTGTILHEADVTTATRVVVLEGVNNPDNIGGLFRSAAAFGVDLVVLGPGCGDPLYRKAIRTSMAATLDVTYVGSGQWPDALDTIRAAGVRVVALTPAADATPLASFAPHERIALLLGTEGTGLTAGALARADVRMRIRMTARVDSLNVTVAAAIAMHHFFAD